MTSEGVQTMQQHSAPNGADRAWTRHDDEYLALSRALGKSAREIAEDLGVSRNAVLGRSHRVGLATPNGTGRRPKLYGAKLDEIVRRYAAGESSGDLAVAFGVTGQAILKALRRAGAPVRTRAQGRALRVARSRPRAPARKPRAVAQPAPSTVQPEPRPSFWSRVLGIFGRAA